jgi:hypothetical protein
VKLIKKMLLATAIAAATATSAQASTITIGGVTWDPDAVSQSDSDFTARYEFNQYFSTAANAVANAVNAAPNYANAINPTTVSLTDVLQGAGEITKFNGVNYGDTASTVGGAFCASCELTFTFGGFAINGPSTFTNGWLRIYVDSTPDFNISTSPAANAADGTLFLELTARSNDFFSSGGFASGSLFTYFDVTGGIAKNNFDTNTQNFATDLLSTASAQFNNRPPFQFIATSTGVITGDSIPEPATVFLMGAALLGLAFARRKTQI